MFLAWPSPESKGCVELLVESGWELLFVFSLVFFLIVTTVVRILCLLFLFILINNLAFVLVGFDLYCLVGFPSFVNRLSGFNGESCY